MMDHAEHQDYEDEVLDEGLVPLQPLLPVRSHTNVVRLDGNNRRACPATKVPISPGVSERRTRTFRATTQAARAARQPQDSLELTAFAANHFGLLQRARNKSSTSPSRRLPRTTASSPLKTPPRVKSLRSSLIPAPLSLARPAANSFLCTSSLGTSSTLTESTRR